MHPVRHLGGVARHHQRDRAAGLVVALRRTSIVLTIVAAAWTGVVFFVDGFYLQLGPLRVSSRTPLNPGLITMLLAAVAAGIVRRTGGVTVIGEDLAALRETRAPAMAPVRARMLAIARAAGRWTPEIIGCAAAALYVHHWAIARPLWLDEEMIALNIRDRSFAELAGSLWLGQSAPLGWLYVQRAVMLLLGTSEIALRLVPGLFGLATVGAAVWTGRRFLTVVGASVLVSLVGFGLYLSHYPFELKPYSADAFWGLLLPVLAVRATQAAAAAACVRRATVWWVVAATALWTANGALFAAPGAAIVMCALIWRRHGWRASALAAAPGVLWLASFGVHYSVSLSHAHHSRYLRAYWVGELPSPDFGVGQTTAWLLARLPTLARAPFGTDWWRTLWLVAAAGFAFGSRPALGLIAATAPTMMLVLGGFGVVPLFERFALWAVPATYLGIALGLDQLWSMARAAMEARRWRRLAVAIGLAVVPVLLTAGIVDRGREDMVMYRPPDHNHGVHDRRAVRWVMSQRRDGDAIATTHLGWPAIWWYGGTSIAGSAVEFEPIPAGAGTFELAHVGGGATCTRESDRRTLKRFRRLIVHIGFRDLPPGFDRLLVQRLAQLGTIVAVKAFSDYSRAAIVELAPPRAGDVPLIGLSRWPVRERDVLEGCFTLRGARRW